MTGGTLWAQAALAGRARVRVQQPLAASDDSEPEPDLAVVPRGDHASDHPQEAWLVVEVAESSLDYDRTEKASINAAMGVPQYLIVNLVDGVVEQHEGPSDGGYARVTIAGHGQPIVLDAYPDVRFSVSNVVR